MSTEQVNWIWDAKAKFQRECGEISPLDMTSYNMMLSFFDLLAEALKGEGKQLQELDGRIFALENYLNNFMSQIEKKPEPAPVKEIEVGDEVWIPATVLELAGDDFIVQVPNSFAENFLIPKMKVHKKEEK